MTGSHGLDAIAETSDEGLHGPDMDTLVALRGDMLRFAQLQLRDHAAAEDLVQESIEAALRKFSTFSGQSTLKTWVFAILRNRIIDHLRQANRSVAMSSLIEDGEDWQEQLETLFKDNGTWQPGARPARWPTPDNAMESRQFWEAFEICLTHLPENSARAFMMREFLGFDTEEICSQLKISVSNCHVLLHRARIKLRGCLEAGWGKP